MKRSMLWGIPAALYLVFCFWYTDLSGPLSSEEIERYSAALTTNGRPPEAIARMRRFMEEDTGRQFVMVNLLDMADLPGTVAGISNESADQLMDRYMEHMWPALLMRACHPIFAGGVVFDALDLSGIDGAEQWTRVALMRYRSRRDLLDVATNPDFEGPHEFKMASLDKTIAVPVETQIYLSDPRFLLLIILIALTAVTDILTNRRRG